MLGLEEERLALAFFVARQEVKQDAYPSGDVAWTSVSGSLRGRQIAMNDTLAQLARSRRPCSSWLVSFTASLVSRVDVDACREGPFSGVRLLLSAGQGDFLHAVARHAVPRGQAHFVT